MGSRRWVWAALATLLLGGGCRWPWEPESPVITGTVRYPGGGRANVAKVRGPGNAATFTDWTGRYELRPQGVVGDTVTVHAADWCRGTCATTRWGYARVVLRARRTTVDIVLDRVDNI